MSSLFNALSGVLKALSTKSAANVGVNQVLKTIVTVAVCQVANIAKILPVSGVQIGNSGNNTLTGTSKNDVIIGGKGNDTIEGLAGKDFVSGGAGDDLFIEGDASGQDTYKGHKGIDTVNYSRVSQSGTLKLAGNKAEMSILGVTDTLIDIETVIGTGGTQDVLDSSTATQAITINLDTGIVNAPKSSVTRVEGFEGAIGGSGNDTLTGSNANDFLNGGSGHDSLIGGAGSDTLIGGTGNDTLNGGIGNDIYKFDTHFGLDRLTDVGGDDTLDFSVITDNITFDAFAASATAGRYKAQWDIAVSRFERIITGSGNDVIISADEHNWIDAGAGNDSIITGSGHDTLIGGVGNDTLNGGTDNDTYIFHSGFGTDSIVDASGTDTLDFSTLSQDVSFDAFAASAIAGTSKAEWNIHVSRFENVQTGSGNDSIITADENNWIDAGSGHDFVLTGAGNDTLYGGAGNDTLNGGTEDDLMDGGEGDDVLEGSHGSDTVYGGAGNDRFMEWSATGSDLYDGGAGFDTVDYGSSAANTWLTLGANVGDSDSVLNNGDTDTLSGIEKIIASSTAGFNTISATNSSSFLSIDLAAGTLSAAHRELSQVINFQHIHAGEHDDILLGDARNNELHGNGGNDSIHGRDGDDFMTGGTGNDTLNGGNGSDILHGDAGHDVLVGGFNSDHLFGGTGNDTYQFEAGDGDDWIFEQDSTPGNLDTIRFGESVSAGSIAIFKTSIGDLHIGYTGNTNDLIRVQDFDSASGRVERFELSNGQYMSDADINQIIADMTAYADANGISLTNLNDVKADADLMAIVNAGWQG